jgi:hypothetical protein
MGHAQAAVMRLSNFRNDEARLLRGYLPITDVKTRHWLLPFNDQSFSGILPSCG